MDGSPGLPPTVELEGVGGLGGPDAVARWRAGVYDPQRLGACAGRQPRWPRSRLVVHRVGVTGESISFRDASGRLLLGCDNSLGPREKGHLWCGEEAGKLEGGRLTDSRLDVGCETAEREPLGFVWIEPSSGAHYLSVPQTGYTEVYEVANALPIRVSTTTMETATDSAILAYAEYDVHGKLLRRATLEGVVAG